MTTETRGWMSSVTALALAISVAQAVSSAMAEDAPNDSRIQTELTKSLNNARFKSIQTSASRHQCKTASCLLREQSATMRTRRMPKRRRTK